MEALVGLLGVVIGALITWWISRGEREARIKEARREEKRIAFARLLETLRLVLASESDDSVATNNLHIAVFEALLFSDHNGLVFKVLGESFDEDGDPKPSLRATLPMTLLVAMKNELSA